MANDPGINQSNAVLAMLKQRLAGTVQIGSRNDRWIEQPFSVMSEHAKAIAYLTDMSD